MNELTKYKVGAFPYEVSLGIICENKKYFPTYANDTDACMDLKIKICKEKTFNNLKVIDTTDTISPNESKVYGTGIKLKIPDDFFIQVFPRSSTGFKLNCRLANTVGIIDTGYRDEIKLKIHNFGTESITLQDGQRIAQFVLLPRPKIKLIEIDDDKEFNEGNRGGGIGSTGK